MAMIPQETVQQILDTAQIVDVVSDFVSLKKRGSSYVACCPFHNEKTPSFYVTPSKGIFKCFGCGKAGTAVGFVMEHEHCSYVEALRYLAKKYHIEIVEEELTPEEIMRRQRHESLLLASEFAHKFFVERLKSGEGKAVGLAYFKSRGLEDETIAKFGLGWAPSGKDEFLKAAHAAGYKDEYLIDAGLISEREDGTLADKFRERVMFPIHSLSGRVIAFSGRALRSDNPAKYMNSPDTPIYTKSNILFGIWHAKGEMAKKGKCIVVEGNLDLVMLHQLGLQNVVAPCGTALTVQQVRQIRKFTDNISLMFDGDNAGIEAALRAIDMTLYEGMNVSVVRLPEGEDPDSFARKHSLEEFETFISQNEQDFLSFKSDILLKDAGSDPLKRATLINDIADTIARIPDAVKRSISINSAAEKFKVETDAISGRVEKTRRKLLEEERREREREKRRYRSGDDAPYIPEPDYGELPPETIEGYKPENRILAPVEEEILNFLLSHGTDLLEFPAHSEEAKEFNSKGISVTEFISDFLDLHGFELENSGYKEVYDAYLQGYDAGYEQDEIVRRMLDSPNRTIAVLTAQFSIQKHKLTVQDLEKSLTAKVSWLANYVPKTMYTYIIKRDEKKIKDLRKSLVGLSGEETLLVLTKIKTIQEEQNKLKKKILEKNE